MFKFKHDSLTEEWQFMRCFKESNITNHVQLVNHPEDLQQYFPNTSPVPYSCYNLMYKCCRTVLLSLQLCQQYKHDEKHLLFVFSNKNYKFLLNRMYYMLQNIFIIPIPCWQSKHDEEDSLKCLIIPSQTKINKILLNQLIRHILPCKPKHRITLSQGFLKSKTSYLLGNMIFCTVSSI